MAILGFGDYLCEACRYFDSDGLDGNHPSCAKQFGASSSQAIPLGRECPFGYEFGIPYCYPVNKSRNMDRVYEIKAMLGKHGKR